MTCRTSFNRDFPSGGNVICLEAKRTDRQPPHSAAVAETVHKLRLSQLVAGPRTPMQDVIVLIARALSAITRSYRLGPIDEKGGQIRLFYRKRIIDITLIDRGPVETSTGPSTDPSREGAA